MSGPERLASIVTALEQLGLPYLVMGGHAVRHYGVDRNTIDFDLHVSLDEWDQLPELLASSPLFAGCPPVEGPSWRARVFRRFQIGRLDDGRAEWLEFWKANHLLAPFHELVARSEVGNYGGRELRFLGLSDLIRSKETERESDWRDVSLLEEIRDERNAADGRRSDDLTRALAELRSRKGFECLFGSTRPEETTIAAALARSDNPISVAFLLPYSPDTPTHSFAGMIGEVLSGPLRAAAPFSARHLALVEAVRRLYKQGAVAADRTDKELARRES